MGTTYTVKVAAAVDAEQRAELSTAIRAALDQVNALMSTYVPSSEVSRFAVASASVAFALSPSTVEVLTKALQVSEKTDGAFDVTVRPLVDAWGFGPDGRPKKKPDRPAIADLLPRVGYQKLRLDADARTLRKTVDAVSIDLSAIAKGYAVDRVAAALVRAGHERFMVEVGGEVRARGTNATGEGWRIGIEAPAEGGRQVIGVVSLPDHGLATSGNYRNYYVEDGVKYAHTIDPRSGQPVRHRLLSASVIHPEAAMADAWATALMVVGPERARQLAEDNGLAVLLTIADERGGYSIETSEGFRPFVVELKGEAQ